MSNIEKAEETTNIIGALKYFGGYYLVYLLYLILQLYLMNSTHKFNVLLMLLSIVVTYAIFIIPVFFIFYILYKIYKCIKCRDIKLLFNGTYTIGTSLFVLIVTCFVHPLVVEYFQIHLFSRAF